MSYSQLTLDERHQIYQWRVLDKHPLIIIADKLDRSVSTISRELRRNHDQEYGYLPETAQRTMQQRRQRGKSRFDSISEAVIHEIKARLQQYCSPEQITGRLNLEGKDRVSHETIYQIIYANHHGLQEYHHCLRRQRVKRKIRKTSNSGRSRIPGRVGIEHRPQIADEKKEIGHWEGDTMMGGITVELSQLTWTRHRNIW